MAIGCPGPSTLTFSPSCVNSTSPSKSQKAERPSAWYQRASPAFTTNQPSVFRTSPSAACSSCASGTTGRSLLLRRNGLTLDREQLEFVAAAVGGVLERDLLTERERDRRAAVRVLAAGDADLDRPAVLGDLDKDEGRLLLRERGLDGHVLGEAVDGDRRGCGDLGRVERRKLALLDRGRGVGVGDGRQLGSGRRG